MAFLTEVPNKTGTSYKVRIRHPDLEKELTKTFKKKSEAKAWAKTEESKLTLHLSQDIRSLKRTQFNDWLIRYREEITPQKGKTTIKPEISKINVLLRGFDGYSVDEITKDMLANYINKRMSFDLVKWDTVKKETNLISDLLHTARVSWDYPVSELVVKDAKAFYDKAHRDKPRKSLKRNRRCNDNEYHIIEVSDHPFALTCQLAIETAARLSELLRLKVEDVNVDSKILKINESKTDIHQDFAGREIPLTDKAIAIIEKLMIKNADKDSLLGYKHADSIKTAWVRFREYHDIDSRKWFGLRFHDLRREAVSRMFTDRSWIAQQVMKVSGHSKSDTLDIYTELKVQDLVSDLQAKGFTS